MDFLGGGIRQFSSAHSIMYVLSSDKSKSFVGINFIGKILAMDLHIVQYFSILVSLLGLWQFVQDGHKPAFHKLAHSATNFGSPDVLCPSLMIIHAL